MLNGITKQNFVGIEVNKNMRAVLKKEVKTIPQVINALAEATGRIKDESIKQICNEIKKTGQADAFDYTRFKTVECDCIVYLDYNKNTKTWLIEITED